MAGSFRGKKHQHKNDIGEDINLSSDWDSSDVDQKSGGDGYDRKVAVDVCTFSDLPQKRTEKGSRNSNTNRTTGGGKTATDIVDHGEAFDNSNARNDSKHAYVQKLTEKDKVVSYFEAKRSPRQASNIDAEVKRTGRSAKAGKTQSIGGGLHNIFASNLQKEDNQSGRKAIEKKEFHKKEMDTNHGDKVGSDALEDSRFHEICLSETESSSIRNRFGNRSVFIFLQVNSTKQFFVSETENENLGSFADKMSQAKLSMRYFWRQVFFIPTLFLWFLFSFLAKLLRFVLKDLLFELFTAVLPVVGDYLIRGPSTVVYNSLLHPILVLVSNILRGLVHTLSPLGRVLDLFCIRVTALVRAFRIVEVNRFKRDDEVGTYDI